MFLDLQWFFTQQRPWVRTARKFLTTVGTVAIRSRSGGHTSDAGSTLASYAHRHETRVEPSDPRHPATHLLRCGTSWQMFSNSLLLGQLPPGCQYNGYCMERQVEATRELACVNQNEGHRCADHAGHMVCRCLVDCINQITYQLFPPKSASHQKIKAFLYPWFHEDDRICFKLEFSFKFEKAFKLL